MTIPLLSKPNLIRVLRRRLGLTQRELAFLVGYEGNSGHVSRIENGSRIPHLAEVLVFELVFGVPAVTVFPQIRHAVGDRMKNRAKALLSKLEKSSLSGTPRMSYKAAQLERVLDSLRNQDDFDRSESYP